MRGRKTNNSSSKPSFIERIKVTKTFHKIEVFTDKSILFAIIILMGLLIVELFFHHVAEEYSLLIEITDSLIILIFSMDLFFKYVRIKPFKTFLKKSWIDIIAIFPFFLIFRLVEFIGQSVLFGEALRQGQSILHETVELEKETSKIIQSVEKTHKLSRTSKLISLHKPLLKLPRIIKAFSFFEHPTKHEPNKK